MAGRRRDGKVASNVLGNGLSQQGGCASEIPDHRWLSARHTDWSACRCSRGTGHAHRGRAIRPRHRSSWWAGALHALRHARAAPGTGPAGRGGDPPARSRLTDRAKAHHAGGGCRGRRRARARSRWRPVHGSRRRCGSRDATRVPLLALQVGPGAVTPSAARMRRRWPSAPSKWWTACLEPRQGLPRSTRHRCGRSLRPAASSPTDMLPHVAAPAEVERQTRVHVRFVVANPSSYLYAHT